jgi:hypothetical protein
MAVLRAEVKRHREPLRHVAFAMNAGEYYCVDGHSFVRAVDRWGKAIRIEGRPS